MKTYFWAYLTLIVLALTPLSAHALPGEYDAVMHHCGQPSGTSQTTSPVTGHDERNLIYGKSDILHFEPMGGGWSFTTAWEGHLPMSRTRLETKMPCFRDAIQEVAAAPRPNVDPSIAAQSLVPQASATTFGTGFLWFVGGLAIVTVLILALLPARRRQATQRELLLKNRVYRKPIIPAFLRRKRPIPKPTEI